MVIGDRLQLTVPPGLVTRLSDAGPQGLIGTFVGYHQVQGCGELIPKIHLDYPFIFGGYRYSFLAMLGQSKGATWIASRGRCRLFLVRSISLDDTVPASLTSVEGSATLGLKRPIPSNATVVEAGSLKNLLRVEPRFHRKVDHWHGDCYGGLKERFAITADVVSLHNG